MDHCCQRIQDAVDDIGDNRLLEEDAMAREVGEINDRDLVENENANDEIEGDNNAFQSLLNMRAYGEAWIAKSFFVCMIFSCYVNEVRYTEVLYVLEVRYITRDRTVTSSFEPFKRQTVSRFCVGRLGQHSK